MIFGNIVGLSVGTITESRSKMSTLGYHKPLQAGIYGASKTGSYSIVLSQGYEDDIDEIDYIKYTGSGGRDPNTGKQIADQEFTKNNKGLQINCDYNLPVRVWRGFQTKYGPVYGYRYDGIYYVKEYRRELGASGFYICRFHLYSENEYEEIIKILDGKINPDSKPPERNDQRRGGYKRDYSIPEAIKVIYENKCQICQIILESPTGLISVGAHIQGLGDLGPDIKSNMLCLCPNHHAQFDAFSFYVEPSTFEIKALKGFEEKKLIINHKIDKKFFLYHKNKYAESN